jgi:hypothetical protein
MVLDSYKVVALLGAIAFTACGGGDEVGDDDAGDVIDAGPMPDARENGFEEDAGPPLPRCAAPVSYGDLGLIPPQFSQAALRFTQDGEVQKVIYQALLNDDTDLLVVELFDHFGVFAGGLRTGIFELTGEELDYATCGVCIRVFGDIGPLGDVRQVFMATSGTVEIREVGLSQNGHLQATLIDLTFEHVNIDPRTFESTPVNDGCESAIEGAHLDEVVQ